jgi:hypothetical protein
MANEDHIHTPEDGKGFGRTVFCDGKKLEYCVYADTKKGVAICYALPLEADVKGNLVKQRYNGKIVVTNGDSPAIN